MLVGIQCGSVIVRVSSRSSRSPERSESFFLIVPPPPRSTLFPYTTLFRSRSDDLVLVLDEAITHVFMPGQHQSSARMGVLGEDRKSTRLNSSHANISYAVFCLKKTTASHASARRGRGACSTRCMWAAPC